MNRRTFIKAAAGMGAIAVGTAAGIGIACVLEKHSPDKFTVDGVSLERGDLLIVQPTNGVYRVMVTA